MACSHERSYILYTDSVSNNCPYTAYPCTSGSEYAAGHCLSCTGTGCSEMGYNSNNFSARGSFYLDTASISPFCGKKNWHKSTTVYNLLVFIYSFFKNCLEVKGNAQFWDRGYLSLLFIFMFLKSIFNWCTHYELKKGFELKRILTFLELTGYFNVKISVYLAFRGTLVLNSKYK